ncbi:hypothetical protein [Burkholderia sp. BE17]|uniref:hypothetical protein n=1 Tax=Burkholderia sp. BE17 TaxID=2656644 RepID=UPI00128D0266|nr:hypothetical protein [Burkholderia sp. BE17]MPV67640.1 hypothetical protein [Burkholderia sp. BE17]
MNWLKQLLRQPVPSPAPSISDRFPLPWSEGRPGIYRFLSSFAVVDDQCLPDAAATLPDEELLAIRRGTQLRWAPGAMDGAFGHHAASDDSTQVERVVATLVSAADTRSAEAVKNFYDLIAGDEALRLVDPLLTSLRQSRPTDPERLHALGRWLASESPDRGAVKIGIALLGMLQPPRDMALLTTLGLHEEFTLYVAVALGNTLPAPDREDAWWSLARRVNGWGRIHLVERLAKTERSDIKAWMLREGYKNSVMIEYLAYPCAVGGDLLRALRENGADDALLNGAGDMLQALIAGGPAQDMGDYTAGAEATSLYLGHLARRVPARLDDYLVASDIARFATDEERPWEALETRGWTAERRAHIAALASAIVADSRWPTLAAEGFSAPDEAAFWTAATVAERLGLDPWEARFDRQRDGQGSQWFYLMRDADSLRVDRVVTLAMEQLCLDDLATGAADDSGLGPGFAQQAVLGAILQELGRFPSKGWPLVEAGLRSPVIRNRNMALKTLSTWGKERWPTAAEAALNDALRAEPNDRVREYITQVLSR